METIKLNIQNYDDREKMIIALANAGYHVWTETKEGSNNLETMFYICFEIKGEFNK